MFDHQFIGISFLTIIKIQFDSRMETWQFVPPVSTDARWVISTFFPYLNPSFFDNLELSKSFYIQISCPLHSLKENGTYNIEGLGLTFHSLWMQTF